MKRILIISLSAMLVLALMIVPAFADTVYSGVYDDGSLTFDPVPPAGTYQLNIADSGYGNYTAIVELVETPYGVSGRIENWGIFAFVEFSIDYGSWTSLAETIDGEELAVVPESVIFTPYVPSDGSGFTVVDSLLAVFSGIGTWLVSQLLAVVALFYTAEGGLTLLGALAVAALGFALVLLLIWFISSFFRFRR